MERDDGRGSGRCLGRSGGGTGRGDAGRRVEEVRGENGDQGADSGAKGPGVGGLNNSVSWFEES